MPCTLEETNPVCPKCGKPYLFVKDWGQAGALFVHGYNTDEASGLQHKDACQVPEVVALGEVTMEDWRTSRK